MPRTASNSPTTTPHPSGRCRGTALFHALAAGVLLFAVVCLCIAAQNWVGRNVLRETLDTELKAIARVAASEIDATLHATLTDPNQQNGPTYNKIVVPLRHLLENSDHYKYIYTIKPQGDKWVFVADASPPGDSDHDGIEDQATMFEVMEDPEPAIQQAVVSRNASVSAEPYTDKWGTFITSYCPVIASDGSIECVVGVDTEADSYMARLGRMDRASFLAAGIALVACVVIATGVYVVQQRRDTAEALLAANRQFLDRAGKVAGVSGWELNTDSDTLNWTSQAQHICQMQGSPLPANRRGLLELFPQTHQSALTSAINECIRHGTAFDLELPLRQITAQSSETDPELPSATPQQRWVRIVGEADTHSPNATCIRGAIQDVTTKVQRQAALTNALNRAEAATRAKSDFLANTSHEIRTPMTAILGFAELIADELHPADLPAHEPLAPGVRERCLSHLETIRRSGNHLVAIINDILDLSKIEAGKLTVERTPVALDQLLNDVIAIMSARLTTKPLTLEVRLLTPIPRVINSDNVRLRQILMNLIGNGIKFTENGSVRVEIAFHPPSTIEINIRDTGMGMTPEQVHRLFRPFEQADGSMTRRFGGTGLGLCISKRLAEMLGGTIRVDSQPGSGSTFTLTFDTGDVSETAQVSALADKPILTRPATVAAVAHTGLSGLRILLVEDGIDNQRLIAHHLRTAGAIVTVADNGRLALQQLTTDSTPSAPLKNPLPVDLILTDMQMPEMDGYTLARALRDKGCARGIIALTAHAMTGDADKCRSAGCDDYASKPVDRKRLIELCRTHAPAHWLQQRAAS